MKTEVERDYTESVGHPPQNLPDDHPDRWQWDYEGTPAQRKRLRRQVLGEDGETVVVEQPTLF